MAKRYNSDYMSRRMDEELERLEDKLTALYANASYDVNQEFAKFIKEFEAKDAELLLQVEAGEITQAEYIRWRNVQILQTDRYAVAVDHMTDILVRADIAAMAIVRGELPYVLAQSYNFTQSLGWAAADRAGLSVGTFQVYNARSVQKLIRENPKLLPTVNVSEDRKWNHDKINKQITTGIIKGEPMDKVASRLQEVANMDDNAAIRNARTAMTGAENMGRAEAADDLNDKGIPVDEEWSATYDNRTRETHLELDGTLRDEDGYFGVGILDTPLRYPADPDGDPSEIYNCRCRLNIRIRGIDHSKDAEIYRKFMEGNGASIDEIELIED